MSVAEYQAFLNDHGYGPLAVDGKNGPATKAAVKRWQGDHGLAQDGVVGPKTAASFQGGGGAAAAPAPATDPNKAVADSYPDILWAVNDPEIGPVLKRYADAAGSGSPWSDNYLQSQLQATNWWKTHSKAARDYLTTIGTDPAEAAAQLQAIGSADKYMNASASYGLPVDWQTAVNQVQRVVRGEIPPDQLEGELRNQAKALYPQLATQIDAGATVKDVYSPYATLAAGVLGINPAEINLSDPKWQTPLQVTDGKGDRRLATTDEWQRILMTDTRFGFANSKNGKELGATRGEAVARTLGAIA